MTGTIYSGGNVGIRLTDPATQDPVTIDSTGTVTAAVSPAALYGAAGTAWLVSNYGKITGGANYDGVYLHSGGTVTNQTSASIVGLLGVYGFTGTLAVTNFGSIGGGSAGVRLLTGGSVTNESSGTITSTYDAIGIGGPGGQVTNAGLLVSGAGVGGVAVSLNGGSLDNTGSIQAVFGAVSIVTNPGTVTNAGTITLSGAVGNHAWGVYLKAGGSVTNAAGAHMSVTADFPSGATTYNLNDASGIVLGATGTVTNNGSIAVTGVWTGLGGHPYAIGDGVILQGGGGVTNAGGANIAARISAVVVVADGAVDNSGGLTGTVAYGVTLLSTGSVTNRQTGSISGGFDGIRAVNAAATATNDGFITGLQNYGVRLGVNGSVTNTAHGTITGGSDGVLFDLAGATLSNAGLISGAGNYTPRFGAGAFMFGGGDVTNIGLGQITGRLHGVYISGAGSVTNAATITGTTDFGVRVTAGGTVSNSGIISGGSIGVDLAGTVAATLIDSGSITGGSAAVLFGSGGNRLVLAPGFAFGGTVDGGVGTNTLELAAGTATLTGLGTKMLNFGDIAFDSGATWLIAGNTAGLSGVMGGFAAGDTIDLTGLHETVLSYTGSALALGGDANLTLNVTSSLPNQTFVARTDAAGTGTDLTLACFAEGTLIRTDHGDVPVEALRVGDRVPTLCGGGSAPVQWLGRRHVVCRRHPRPADVWPVRVAAGAFGEGRPARALRLSPDHAVYVDGVLIPIRHLINGSSIVQEQVDSITYLHVELPRHDVLLAEGLPCESYLDTGNRAAFANGGAVVAAHPDFARGVWDGDSCAPLLLAGPDVAAARASLLERGAQTATEVAMSRNRLVSRSLSVGPDHCHRRGQT